MCTFLFIFFFFKQKTAYELLISDWSSDVCSSDRFDQLRGEAHGGLVEQDHLGPAHESAADGAHLLLAAGGVAGRAAAALLEAREVVVDQHEIRLAGGASVARKSVV